MEDFKSLIQNAGDLLLNDLTIRRVVLPDSSRLVSRFRFSVNPPISCNTVIRTDIDRAIAAIGCETKIKVGTLCFMGLDDEFWKGDITADTLFDLTTNPILPCQEYRETLSSTKVVQPKDGQVIILEAILHTLNHLIPATDYSFFLTKY